MEEAGWILKCVDLYLFSQMLQNWWNLKSGTSQYRQNDPITHNATQEILKANEFMLNVEMAEVWMKNEVRLTSATRHAFHILIIKMKAERPRNKQQLKAAAVMAPQKLQGGNLACNDVFLFNTSRQPLTTNNLQLNTKKNTDIYYC